MKAFQISKSRCGIIFEGSNMAEAARVCGVSTTYMRKVLLKNLAKGNESFTIKSDLFRITFSQGLIDFAKKHAGEARFGKFVNGYLIKDSHLDDRNDCGVRALAWAANIKYAEAHEAFRIHAGRKKGQGVYDHQIDEAIKGIAGEGKIKIIEKKFIHQTINRFVDENPEGRFYCVVRGHAFAIVNGIVYDNANRTTGRHRIQRIWQVAL